MLFVLSSIVHFVYDIFNLDIIALVFPVNESIFQHMKMIFTAYFIFYIGLFLLREKLKINNIFLTNLISVVICIVFFLVIYLPVRFRFGENMIFTFILLFLSFLVSQEASYCFLKKDYNKGIDVLSLSIIFILFIIFAYFTFNPIENDFFWDPEHETYERVIK